MEDLRRPFSGQGHVHEVRRQGKIPSQKDSAGDSDHSPARTPPPRRRILTVGDEDQHGGRSPGGERDPKQVQKGVHPKPSKPSTPPPSPVLGRGKPKPKAKGKGHSAPVTVETYPQQWGAKSFGGKDKSSVQCWNCGRWGHSQAECRAQGKGQNHRFAPPGALRLPSWAAGGLP